jgi:hypothetical protein
VEAPSLLKLTKKGKFTTGRSKPYIFASPQELEKVIVPS